MARYGLPATSCPPEASSAASSTAPWSSTITMPG